MITDDNGKFDAKSEETPDLNWGVDEQNDNCTNASQNPALAAQNVDSVSVSAQDASDDVFENKSANEAQTVEETKSALEKLGKEREEALKKIQDRFDAKEFAIRHKAISISARRMNAYEFLERQRKLVREKLNAPYIDDEDIDVHVEKAFQAGLHVVVLG